MNERAESINFIVPLHLLLELENILFLNIFYEKKNKVSEKSKLSFFLTFAEECISLIYIVLISRAVEHYSVRAVKKILCTLEIDGHLCTYEWYFFIAGTFNKKIFFVLSNSEKDISKSFSNILHMDYFKSM